MADSPKLTILKRLTTLLEATVVTPYTYTIANGAPSALPATLAGVVFRGRSVLGADAPDTLLSILEAPRQSPSVYAGAGEARHDLWGLQIHGMCPEDANHPSDPIYGLLEDVEKQLQRIVKIAYGRAGQPMYTDDYMLGRNAAGEHMITKFEFQSGIVARPASETPSSRTFFYIPVQVGIAKVVTD